MEPKVEPIREILEELFSLLETFETQSIAITQFLKDQGIATDEKLAPYLDRAGNTSSVKWRAARARMQYLLSPVQDKKKDSEQSDKQSESEKQTNQAPPMASTEGSIKKPDANDKRADGKNPEAKATEEPQASPQARKAKPE